MTGSRALLVFGACLAACLALALVLAPGDTEPERPQANPNIVYVVADDLDAASARKIPGFGEYMADEGVTFENAFVTHSMCCPSRATMLTGRYSHNHRVRRNQPPLGGFQTFRELGLEDSTVATWLDGAGYETVHLGKYLNGYGLKSRTYVPPGWDQWYAAAGNRQLNHNGHIDEYRKETYHDDLLSGLAQQFVRDQKDTDRPFFVHLSVHAPHEPANPAPRHEGLFRGELAPRTPAFGEADVSDKPRWVRRSPLSRREKRHIDDLYADRLRTTTAVGEAVGGMVRTLEESGKLDNTYLILTSDNGYHMGQHGLSVGKGSAYEEDIRVPLMVRGPGIASGETRDALVLNNDLAPTFADLANVTHPNGPPTDGRSFAPMLDDDPQNDPTSWRTAFEVGFWRDGDGGIPTYRAVRTLKHLYVEYATGERELYDLHRDPYQLESLHDSAAPSLLADLKARLDALRDCVGRDCRAAEDGPPGPTAAE